MDLALNDEGQQYSNLDEASAIARVSPKMPCCLVWRPQANPWRSAQNGGSEGLRRKLLRRPIALRKAEYLQPQMLGSVVLRYLEETDGSPVNDVRMCMDRLDRSSDGGRNKGLSNLKLLQRWTKRNQTLRTHAMQKFFVAMQTIHAAETLNYSEQLIVEHLRIFFLSSIFEVRCRCNLQSAQLSCSAKPKSASAL